MTDPQQGAFHYYFDQPSNELTFGQAQFQPEDKDKFNYIGHPLKVGSYKSNSLGLYDMHGNVAEWCDEESDYTRLAPQHPIRGGHWYCRPEYCTAVWRVVAPNDQRHAEVGFRVARVRVAADN